MELGLAAKRPPGDYWDEEENDYLTQPGDARYRLRAWYAMRGTGKHAV